MACGIANPDCSHHFLPLGANMMDRQKKYVI